MGDVGPRRWIFYCRNSWFEGRVASGWLSGRGVKGCSGIAAPNGNSSGLGSWGGDCGGGVSRNDSIL